MNARLLCLSAGLVLGVCSGTVRALPDDGNSLQSSAASASVVPARRMDREAMRLIREDVAKMAPVEKPASQTPPNDSPAEVYKMERFIVREDKLPDLSTPPETRVERFVRTGTLSAHIGKKVTTRFWMKGDKGLMLSFSR